MSQQNEGLKAFIANGAIEVYRRVKISSAADCTIVKAGVGEASIGVSQKAAADTDEVTVRLRTSGKTFKVTAAGSFSAGATLYAAADGKVDDASTGSAIGTALEAASNDGDIVEMLPA